MVDAMGGDHAPAEPVAGALDAARNGDVRVTLVGPAAVIAAEIGRFHAGGLPPGVSVVDAPDVVGMDESPLVSLRRKPRASIKVAAELVGDGKAEALYSAGHTGATLLATHTTWGQLPGAERPALAVLIPTLTGQSVLLDTGATVDCRPEHLRAFALMGAAYAKVALSLPSPKVALLSVGEESGKGNELVREAHGLLSATRDINFMGNIEARDFFSGHADVIVCDGFTGNVVLKVGEGLVETLERMLKRELGQSLTARLAGRLTRDGFVRLRKRVDASERGGAPLLGVNGLALVGHGRSNARAIRNGIGTAARLVQAGVMGRLRDALRANAPA